MNTLVNYVESERAGKTFYPTPLSLIEKMLSGIKWNYISSVLEPSAGKGDIAQYVAEKLYYSNYRYPCYDEHSRRKAVENADIDCIEIDPMLRNVLEGKGFRVIHDDFLGFQTQKQYSLIVMNPPFDQGAEHLHKAMELAEKGGTVVCLLNAETLRNPCTPMRKRVLRALEGYEADIEYIEGAFSAAERRTDADIAVVKVTIPEPELDSTIMEGMREAPTYKCADIPNEYAELVRYNKIEEWVNRFNYEVACGIRLIEEYQAMSAQMLDDGEGTYGRPLISLKVYVNGRDEDARVNQYIRLTRGKYWRTIFEQPVITSKLTSKLLNELRANVQKLMDYEFSVYNILTLIIKMNGRVIQGIEDTIIALFDDWTHLDWNKYSPNRHYYNGWATNQAFRVGKKVIIPFYGYDDWYGKFRAYNAREKMRDIEKVFDFLDNGRTEWEGTTDAALDAAEKSGDAKNVDTKYFTATFYKKGTAHLVFKDMELLEKFNIFASQKKGWLPPSYGKKRYTDMDEEEKHVIDTFQGREQYEKVIQRRDYYLNAQQSSPLMIMAPA